MVSPLTLFIITGLSGAGKSTALAAFEDKGYYCVDNMPTALLPKFIELPMQGQTEVAGLVFGMDLREKTFLNNYEAVFKQLRSKGYHLEILFIEADEDTLQQRYSQTRRHHPLAQSGDLMAGIRNEKAQLKGVREIANQVINTTHYSVHQLKQAIVEIAESHRTEGQMRTHILSFGFKYGVPRNADIVMDVRFLANPYFVASLKPLDGRSEPIYEFVTGDPQTTLFMEKFLDLLDYLIPLYKKEGKSYVTIAIGCTGGRHRSVVIAQLVNNHLETIDIQLKLTHRDIQQESV